MRTLPNPQVAPVTTALECAKRVDGAAAIIVASPAFARQHGLPEARGEPRATDLQFEASKVPPEPSIDWPNPGCLCTSEIGQGRFQGMPSRASCLHSHSSQPVHSSRVWHILLTAALMPPAHCAAVEVLGGGEASGPPVPPADITDTMYASAAQAAAAAFADAGVAPGQVHYWSLYDCFPVCFIRCARGRVVSPSSRCIKQASDNRPNHASGGMSWWH
jgi:hypothetical protein